MPMRIGDCYPRSLRERQCVTYRWSGDREWLTATVGELVPQTAARAGKRVGSAACVATGTATFARTHMKTSDDDDVLVRIEHFSRGSVFNRTTHHFYIVITISKQALPYQNLHSPFPYGEWKSLIPILKRGSPYRNGDQRITVLARALPITIRGLKNHLSPFRNGDYRTETGIKNHLSPFQNGDHRIEMGIKESPYVNGHSPFPYREWKIIDPHFYTVITI